MLDIKWIRENLVAFDLAMKNRGAEIRVAEILKIDEQRRKITTQIQELQNRQNIITEEVSSSASSISQLGITDPKLNLKSSYQIEIEESKGIKQNIKELEEEFGQIDQKLKNLLATLPNIPDISVPIGKDENDNKEIEKWGSPRQFDFTSKEHFEIGEDLGLLDFEQSALMSGARFSTLFDGLAKLERALSNFMLDMATEFGYIEISPPNLVKSEAMFASGQLPKFAEDAFCTKDNYWLIPTSEVSLVNLVAQKTLDEKTLPLRFTAYTSCFRSEAGAAGKDTRGMIRQHQFKKVELVSITAPEKSAEEHERMTDLACEILRRLELPYRKILLCSGDIGFCSTKTYDLEVWLPGQNKYREISSCSNCGDFQARRLKAKYKSANNKKPIYVHTLNGSALAVGRTIVAIMENYQNRDGSITIPEVLISYMNGVKLIVRSE